MGDSTEHESFEAFQRYVDRIEITADYNPDQKLLAMQVDAGSDRIELGFKTDYAGDWDRKISSLECFLYRRFNGQDMLLPGGIYRDSTYSQQGNTGLLAKSGAVLRGVPGRMMLLQTEPESGTVAAYNPLPDANRFELTLPGQMTVTADGDVSLLGVLVVPEEGRFDISYAAMDDQAGPGWASHLLIRSPKLPREVTVNGQPAAAHQDVDGVYRVPLPMPQADEPLPEPPNRQGHDRVITRPMMVQPHIPSDAASTTPPPTPTARIPRPPHIQGVASASDTDSGHLPDHAFDGDITTKWLGNARDAWIQIHLPQPVVLASYTITFGEDVPARDPRSWKLLGSTDGATWTVIDRRDVSDQPVFDRLATSDSARISISINTTRYLWSCAGALAFLPSSVIFELCVT